MDEVSRLVQQTLEARGVLPALRAQLLAAVYTAVDDKERTAGIHLERNDVLKSTFDLPEGALAHGLVVDYLESLGLHATASCLKSEVGEMPGLERSREEVAEAAGVSPSDPRPLLLQVLTPPKP